MKLINMAIIATIVISSAALPFTIKQNRNIEAEQLKVKYSEIVDNAVKDASKCLINTMDTTSAETFSVGDKVNYKTAPLNLDKALWRFYQTMYINMGIENDYSAQQVFFDKVPIKVAVGYDGYNINAWTEIYDSTLGKNKVVEMWQDKKNYTLFDDTNRLQIDFTLDENVYVTNKDTGVKTFGNYKNYTTQYPAVLSFTDKFDSIRRQIIVNSIMNDLKYNTERNNLIAIKNGWQYDFKLPYIDNTSINDIGFIAFLQGLPLNGIDYYNTYGFGEAKIVRKVKYYGYEVNGKKFYRVQP